MSTTIIAVRHAKPFSEGYADETLRPLHKEGIATQKRMTQLLLEKGYTPTRIYSSPILRARQTADIIAGQFALGVEVIEALGYDLNPDFLTALASEENNQTLVFVGHAPTLGNYVNDLVGKSVLPTGLSKSGIAIISFDYDTQHAAFIEYLKP